MIKEIDFKGNEEAEKFYNRFADNDIFRSINNLNNIFSRWEDGKFRINFVNNPSQEVYDKMNVYYVDTDDAINIVYYFTDITAIFTYGKYITVIGTLKKNYNVANEAMFIRNSLIAGVPLLSLDTIHEIKTKNYLIDIIARDIYSISDKAIFINDKYISNIHINGINIVTGGDMIINASRNYIYDTGLPNIETINPSSFPNSFPIPLTYEQLEEFKFIHSIKLNDDGSKLAIVGLKREDFLDEVLNRK